jgi:Raf kinase inhibitor-like YbhB/YbcL family protein
MARRNVFRIIAIVALVSTTVLPATAWAEPTYAWEQPQGGNMALAVSSPSFQNGGEIPKKFTCTDADVSPELEWTAVPGGTQSLALIADDPDAPAGTWTHWILFDLPAETKSLPENVSKQDELPNGARQGRNDFRKIGYGGPCPPTGKPHRYFFKLYALDRKLDLKPGASKQDVEQAMQGHILAQGELMGRFQR